MAETQVAPQIGEADGDVVARPMPQAEVDAQQRAVRNLVNQPRIPEIVDHPSNGPSPHFNTMADKLKSAMAEVHKPSAAVAPPSQTAPVPAPPANDAKELASSAASKATAAPSTPITEDELPFTKAKAEDWKKLKGSLNEWRTKAQEVEKKVLETEKALLEYKAKAVPKEQFEEASKQAQAHKEAAEKLTDKLKLVALEQSEEFGGYFQKQFDSALERIKDSAGDQSEQVQMLVQAPAYKGRKEELQRIISQLPDIDRASVALAIADYDRVANDKSKQLRDWKENYERLMAQREQKNKQSEEMKVLQENVLLKELVGELGQDDNDFKLADGDEAHNAKVAQRLDIAEKFYRGQLERHQMQKLLRTALKYDPEKEKSLIEKLAQAEEAIASYKNSNPNVSGASARTAKPPTGGATNQERPFLSKFMSVLGQEQ